MVTREHKAIKFPAYCRTWRCDIPECRLAKALAYHRSFFSPTEEPPETLWVYEGSVGAWSSMKRTAGNLNALYYRMAFQTTSSIFVISTVNLAPRSKSRMQETPLNDAMFAFNNQLRRSDIARVTPKPPPLGIMERYVAKGEEPELDQAMSYAGYNWGEEIDDVDTFVQEILSFLPNEFSRILTNV